MSLSNVSSLKGVPLTNYFKKNRYGDRPRIPLSRLPYRQTQMPSKDKKSGAKTRVTLLFLPTREIPLNWNNPPPPPYLAPFTTSGVTWNFAWVSMSRTEGMGAKVGWEWYQPTTANPRSAKSSEACVWDTGSISHWSPVLKLRQGIALETYTSKTMNKRLRLFLQQTQSISVQVCKEHNWQLAFNTLESCE